eukprot:2367759-Rhodomonas_salina.1
MLVLRYPFPGPAVVPGPLPVLTLQPIAAQPAVALQLLLQIAWPQVHVCRLPQRHHDCEGALP